MIQQKAVLLTGATKGIGLAITRMLSQNGAKLLLNARSLSALETLQADLKKMFPGAEIEVLAGNMGDSQFVERLIQTAIHHYGRLDILINNAGISPRFALLQELSTDDIDATIDVNLKGPLYAMKYAMPQMVHQGGGMIINLNSIAGKVAFPYSSVYCASKFGLHALTECVAEEQRANNIRIVGIYPGAVDTPIWQTIEPGVQQDPERMIDAEDIAEAVRYILTQPGKVTVKEITLMPTRPPVFESLTQ
jgi:NADP-dependent 3-hydroxy acid dehydrogenase YdfG